MSKAVVFTDGKFQAIGNDGNVVPYGKLYFFDAVTGAAVVTYTDSSMSTENPHPIILSASGKADVFLGDATYNVTLKDKNDVTIWTINNFTPAGGSGTVVPVVVIPTKEEFTGIVGSSLILTDTPLTTVDVFKNGLILNTDDYTLDGNTIVFAIPLIVSDEIVVEFTKIIGNGNNSIVYAVDSVTDLLSIDEIGSVNVRGYSSKNDGGEGTFNWDSTIDKSTANGGTIIDPSASLALQGTGVGTGCWVRQYSGAVDVKWFGAVGDGVTDDTIAIKAAFAAHPNITLQNGYFILTDEIVIITAYNVHLNANTIIEQTTADKAIFKAISRNNVWIHANGAQLLGEGSWSNTWTGNDGHNDRVIQFINCNNSGITNPIIKNGANAGLSIEGCNNVKGLNLKIEGTHTHGVPLSANDNFQNGIYIKHSPTYGDCNDIECTFDISGTAQGVLVEVYTGYTGNGDSIQLKGIIHDIPGQHACYIQAGDINVDLVARNIALDACKVQCNQAYELKNVNLKINAENCSSHGIELQNANTPGAASLTNIIIDLVAHNCQRGLGINYDVKNIKARIDTETIEHYPLILQGTGLEDIDIDITSKSCGRHGVYISGATDSKNIFIKPKIREANTSAGSYHGIFVESALDVTFIDPEATDGASNQVYGLYIATGNVSVLGRAVLTGASSYSARSNVELVEWTDDYVIDGTTQASILNHLYFTKSKKVITATAQTTSTTNVEILTIPIPDESAFLFSVDIVGKLANSSERIAAKSAVCVYRDAGGAVTLQAAATTIMSAASGGNTGAYAWVASGNNLLLRVNSGAAATYDWKAKLTRVPVF